MNYRDVSRQLDDEANKLCAVPIDNYARWNDRHLGEDIYIIGGSPQLNDLTDEHLAALEGQVTLGGNNTYYQVPLSYNLSAYPQEATKATFYLPKEKIIHMKLPREPRLVPGVFLLNRIRFVPSIGLSRYLSQPVPGLYTKQNQALAMTHLAIIMGAKRIIFIGVDQRNYAYYWQYKDEIRSKLRADLRKLQGQEFANVFASVKARETYFEHNIDLVEQDGVKREVMPFYQDFTPLFELYFSCAHKFGIEVIATLENSVIHNAGATYKDLDTCLGEAE